MSSTEYRAKKSGPTRARWPSWATALAPFSQNSAVCRSPASGSGQAQLMQSKPSVWFRASRALAARTGPMFPTALRSEIATASGPAAECLGGVTSRAESSTSWTGGFVTMARPYAGTARPAGRAARAPR